ncbi:MAG: polyamine ABC transporter ATP-binding protein, partial [Epulopiscium sp.]|nr:polyamine ABC transporter ATP-binding protein [Candidatus Epulonipiscium sp.]
PEEFSICTEGIKTKIKNKTFLGKYINYELNFEDQMIFPEQPSIEFSQDVGHAEKIYEVGDEIILKPNKYKINVFTEDGSESLIKDVKKYE